MYLMGCSNWYLALSDSGKLKRGLELRVVSDSTCQTERASESIWYSYASLQGSYGIEQITILKLEARLKKGARSNMCFVWLFHLLFTYFLTSGKG